MKFAITSLITATLLLGACGDNPYDPQTWIKKLDEIDPAERKKALKSLRELEDPVAISALGEAWRNDKYDSQYLKTIIELARPLKATDKYVEVEQNNGKIERRLPDGFDIFLPDEQHIFDMRENAHWNDALPFLEEALEKADESDSASLSNAITAMEALAEAKIGEGALKSFVKRSFRDRGGISTRMKAIEALGAFEAAKVEDTLIELLADDDEELPGKFAASKALADVRSQKAIVPLLKALFSDPRLYQAARKSIVAVGAPATPIVRDVFLGRHAELNALGVAKKYTSDCGTARGQDTGCTKPGHFKFGGAALLGDLGAETSKKELIAELSAPAVPAFFLPGGTAGPAQHSSVLSALLQLNASEGAGAVKSYWANAKASDKARAIQVYAHIAKDRSALPELSGLMRSGSDESVRLAAGQAYGLLANQEADLAPIVAIINQYKAKADKAQATADPLIEKFEAARKTSNEYEVKNGQADKIFQKIEQQFKEQEAVASTFEGEALENFNIIKQKYEADKPGYDARAPQRDSLKKARDEAAKAKEGPEREMKTNRRSQRTFEVILSSIKAGTECSGNADCMIDKLDLDAEGLLASMSSHISDGDKWSDDHKKALVGGVGARMAVDLGKLGKGANGSLKKLLAKAPKKVGGDSYRYLRSTERSIREPLLLALRQMVSTKEDCAQVSEALGVIVRDQGSQSRLKSLTSDAEVAKYYFNWACGE